ncbi:cobalt-precorrin-7 (C(5))-methyltransferase [Dehalococcoides mccartyi]|uniref:cobalt-precorrin-7 (C(5))-methyltransferase n=1 Tax=Dehalococcoides mccartyi TaxID=61435 RepID=UPI0021B0DB1E|nr:cobalt-precorrin-7 (C(5))-methyltransferase [Dehalococcoides mccartyi]
MSRKYSTKWNGLSKAMAGTVSRIYYPRVFVTGVGTGGRAFLTPAAEETVKSCGIIVGWPEVIKNLRFGLENKLVLEQNCINYQQLLAEAAGLARAKLEDVALLVMDDPLVYSAGLGGYSDIFKDFRIEFIPAVSSLQLLAASARLSLEDCLQVVYKPDASGNIDQTDLALKRERMLKALKAGYHILVLSDLEQTLAQTACFLIEKGLAVETGVIVGEQMGTDSQKITEKSILEVSRDTSHWISCMAVRQGKILKK